MEPTRSLAAISWCLLAALSVACGGAPVGPEAEAGRQLASHFGLEGAERSSLAEIAREPQSQRESPPGPEESAHTLTLSVELTAGAGPPIVHDGDGVWVLDPEDYDREAFAERASLLGTKQAWELVETFGERVCGLVASEGRIEFCSMPHPSRRSEVVVRMGDLVGRRTLGKPRDRVLRVVVDRPVRETITMYVVDRDGGRKPGVPVWFGKRGGAQGITWKSWDHVARSDAEGHLLVVPLPDDEIALPDVLGERAESAIRAGGDIVMPPFGSVEVELEPGPGLELALSSTTASWNRHRVQSGAKGDGLRFDRVGIGLGLQLKVWDDFGWYETSFPGPARAGDVVRVEAKLRRFREVRARLLRADGNPFVDWDVSLEIPGLTRVERATTDGNGELAVQFGMVNGEPTPGGEVLMHLTSAPLGDDPGALGHFALVTMPEGDGAGDFDLGSVTLQQQPLLAAGRVVDVGGEPVARAKVRLGHIRTNWSGQIRERVRWSGGYSGDTLVRTADDGTFELRSIFDQTTGGSWALNLQAEARGFADSVRANFEPGATELELVLRRTGSVRIEVPKGLGSMVEGVLRSKDSGEERRVELTGAVTVEKVHEGWHDLVITLAGAPLVTIEGLPVRDGETTEDPRLLPIDLDDLLRPRRIRLVDEAGSPQRKVELWYRTAAEWKSLSRWPADGWLNWRHPSDAAFRVWAESGGAPVDLGAFPDGATVTLRDHVPVDLTFTGDHAGRLEFDLIRAVPGEPPIQVGQVRCDVDGNAQARLPGPGSYMVQTNSSFYSAWSGVRFELEEGATAATVSPPN